MKAHGAVVWFTGLSGSGKTTIAMCLLGMLKKLGKTVLILDGDQVRAEKKLRSFARDDICANNRDIIRRALQLSGSYSFVLVSVITPFRILRKEARRILGARYIEAFVDTPIFVCIERDTKGLYKRALKGEITHVIGIDPSVAYEKPVHPDLVLHTEKYTADELAEQCIRHLEGKKYL